MTKYILYTGLAITGFSMTLLASGLVYRSIEDLVEASNVYGLTSTGYEVEK